MKVTGVNVLIHNRPAPHAVMMPPGTIPLGVLSIETDEGLVGNSFISVPGTSPQHIASQILQVAKPLLMGDDPLQITRHWSRLTSMSRSLHPAVVGCVDVALWDLAGKAASMPIHRMLGTYRESIPSYLSSWIHGSTADYVEEALHFQSEGWRGYKLHPLTQRRNFGERIPFTTDIETCTAVREAVGSEMDLMLDSAWAYDHREAVNVGLAIQQLGFLWYEDPLRYPDDLYGYAKLREKLTIPIIATEITEGGVFAYPPWLEQRATDALRGDPVIKGGITGMMKIAHLAEAYRLNCEVHDSYSSLMNVAALHVVAAISNTSAFEVLTINAPGDYSLGGVSYGLQDALDFDRDGTVHAPTKPGLGHDIDWELLRSNSDAVMH